MSEIYRDIFKSDSLTGDLEGEVKKLGLDDPVRKDCAKIIKHYSDLRDAILDALAPTIELVMSPDMHMISECRESTYRSQGWGAAKYARAYLRPLEEKLDSFGFETRVDEVAVTFQLFANCEDWMADCVRRQITFADISLSVGRTINVCALYPGLHHSFLEKHYRICD